MNILAIETTGSISSVAVINDKGELFRRSSRDSMNHLRDLIPMIGDTLADAGISKKEIGRIAVSAGPGSFTGIRIGMATAKILAMSLGLEAAVVPTLPAFAAASRLASVLICPLIDARRGQVYAGAYRAGDSPVTPIPGIAAVIPDGMYDAGSFIHEAVAAAAADPAIRTVEFCGDGAGKYAGLIDEARRTAAGPADVTGSPASYDTGPADEAGLVITIRDEDERCQDAALIAQAATGMAACTYDRIEPIYLRRSEAERKLENHELGIRMRKSSEPEVVIELPPADEKISYRTASRDDAEAFAALDAACFGRSWDAASFTEELDGTKDTCYIAAENESSRMVGLAGITYIAGEGEIDRVAVDRLYRARGIGGEMIKWLIADADVRGVSAITLEVREANRSAITLYKNSGFRVEGRRKGYYQETGENALIMWRRQAEQAASGEDAAGTASAGGESVHGAGQYATNGGEKK